MNFIFSHLSEPSSLNILHNKKIALIDLEYFQGTGNYTILYLRNGEQIVLTKTLKYYELLLTSHDFIRPNKSYLLNPRYIVAHTGNKIRVQSGKCFVISRRKQKTLTYPNQWFQ